MIEWFYEVMDDTYSEETKGFWKRCETMPKEEKDTAIKEHMAKERPYSSGYPHIKAMNFASAMRKIEKDLKENAPFIPKDESFYLSVDRDYQWCGWQLDISIEGLDNEYRLVLEYDADPNQELEEEEIEEIQDDIGEQTEEWRGRY